jgi:hypothetical protein
MTVYSLIQLLTGTLRQMAATTAARGGQAGGPTVYLSLCPLFASVCGHVQWNTPHMHAC